MLDLTNIQGLFLPVNAGDQSVLIGIQKAEGGAWTYHEVGEPDVYLIEEYGDQGKFMIRPDQPSDYQL